MVMGNIVDGTVNSGAEILARIDATAVRAFRTLLRDLEDLGNRIGQFGGSWGSEEARERLGAIHDAYAQAAGDPEADAASWADREAGRIGKAVAEAGPAPATEAGRLAAEIAEMNLRAQIGALMPENPLQVAGLWHELRNSPDEVRKTAFLAVAQEQAEAHNIDFTRDLNVVGLYGREVAVELNVGPVEVRRAQADAKVARGLIDAVKTGAWSISGEVETRLAVATEAARQGADLSRLEEQYGGSDRSYYKTHLQAVAAELGAGPPQAAGVGAALEDYLPGGDLA